MTDASQLTVVVRVRPLSEEEKVKRHFQCVFPLDRQRILLVDPEKYENNILRQNRQHERQFQFDAAFGPSSSHDDVHAATTGPLVDSVVEGFNATVFAYGATGSGKTYTMIGTKEKPGLMTLLTKSLYEKINLDEFQEVYNEVIRDLLNPSSGMLELMEDERGCVQVPGLSSVRAPNISRIMQILQEGNMRRTQEATEANKTSSRSHALLQVSLMRHGIQHGKLFLIDLAGSERASQTKNRGQRLKEGAAINRSLLALGNVINSLSSGNKARYVNYRDSKLTRLLKDSLGGNARTCMIAHVTPSSGHYEETYNTLVYANRAKNITVRPVRNRPKSADEPYSEAMKELRRDLEKRGSGMPHAASTTQLDRNPEQQPRGLRMAGMKWNTSSHPQQPAQNGTSKRASQHDARTFASLFNTLKEQYMTLTDKQNKLRERLMKANREAYEADMSRTSKMAILAAWSKQKSLEGEEKATESIERLKKDVEEQDLKLSQLVETRRKVEKALRKGTEMQTAVETRLRGLATSSEQKELIELIVRMANTQAEKISAENDLAIQDVIMKKTDSSMAKLQRYEMLTEKLIEGKVADDDRSQLEQEYRMLKNQFHYHLIPLRNIHQVVSWNTLLLNKISNNNNNSTSADDLGKTYVASELRRKKRDSVHLPLIHTSASRRNIPGETLSELRTKDSCRFPGDRGPASPTSLHLPPIYTSSDSASANFHDA